MPVSPTLAENLAAATVQAYLDAERALLTLIAASLAKGMDAPGWAESQLFAVQAYRRQAERILTGLSATTARTVNEAISTAANRGTAAAVAELSTALGTPVPELLGRLPGQQAVVALVRETLGVLSATHPRILRATTDAYRQVIADVSSRTLLGAETRRQTAQTALDRFAARGITGFVDSRGRGWDLASYTEMAVRAATMNATMQAHTDRLTAAGLDLVIVSDAPQECIRCRPWEGKVLSLTGIVAGAIMRERSVVDGRMVTVHVAGTLAEARAAGLYHPGCRHSHSAYFPGLTKAPTGTADPAGDKARQKLRYLERRVRAAKREQAVALDDTARRAAGVKVRHYQALIRDHVNSTSAKRQPQREQIGSAR